MEILYPAYLISLIILVVLSAMFSAAEMAIFSTSKTKVKALVHKNIPNSKTLEAIKQHPKDVLTAILVGNNIVNISASALATVFFINVFGAMGALISTITMTAVILTFGEIMPKSYATHNAEKLALKLTPFLSFIMKLLKPIIKLFQHFTRFSSKTSDIGTEEELRALVSMGVEEGKMEKREKELIENVLQFNDITVRDVMTPRTEMLTLDGEMTVEKAVRVMLSREYSRYPVYSREKENIIGIIHIKDALVEYTSGKRNAKLKSLVNTPLFVPVHRVLNDLFKDFQDKRVHMAIVVNDFGEVIGLVTLEDLIEELVGEIIDEKDVKQTMIKRIDKNTVIVHGMTELKDLQRFIHLTLTGKKTDTINAIILKKIRRIPKPGEKITIENNEIEIVEATPKQITKIKLKRTYEL